MDTPADSYFARLIAECRTAFGRSGPSILRWLGLGRRPGGGDDGGVSAQLRPHYRTLADRGRVVWGAVAQANMHLFAAGTRDLPGSTVYSTDGYYDAHPHDLTMIGRACFRFKNTVPADEEFRLVAALLTDEYDQTPRIPVPRRLADGREVFLGSTMFHRARLPGRVLRANLFPIVIAPDRTEFNMVLPLACWSSALRATWDSLQDRLQASPITTAALQIAEGAEKRPWVPNGPDWDTAAEPIRVTAAMVERCRRFGREMGLDTTPFLVIGFREDGTRSAEMAGGYDAATERAFTSGGVTVVIRRDDEERLRGAVVDFQSSALETGVVIRLAGE